MNALERVRAWWQAATPIARAAVVTGLTVLVVGAGYLLMGPENLDMAPLYTRLDPGDAQAIAERLEQDDVPHRIGSDGTTIEVPRSRVASLRLSMASEGLPRGGGVGFELFDRSDLMMTDFTQKVNYRRALQGELARTISQMPEVESARVHLAIPDNSLFTRNRTEPSASVYVRLRPGRVLGSKQSQGILHLVSSSVENLPASKVALLDGSGRLLGPPPDSDGLGATSRALGLTQEFERHMERRIVELLEPVAGIGRVVSRVNADLDLSRVEETSEDFDPDNRTLRSERTLEETTSQERAARGGLAGTPGNLPQRPEGNGGNNPGSRSNSDRKTIETDYAVPKIVRRTQRSIGEVQRLSIAVLVDRKGAKPDSDSTEDDPTTEDNDGLDLASPALSEEAIAQVIKKAVGFDPERGDQLQVVFAPFTEPETGPGTTAQVQASMMPSWVPILGAMALMGLLVGGTIFATERRRIKKEREEEARIRAQQEELAKQADGDQEHPIHLKDQVRELAGSNVKATIEVLKGWLAPTQENHGG